MNKAEKKALAGVLWQRVNERLEASTYSARSLSEAAGMEGSYIYNATKNSTYPNDLTLRKIASALECRVSDLTGSKPSSEKQEFMDLIEGLSESDVDFAHARQVFEAFLRRKS